jgi:hypothetical protein
LHNEVDATDTLKWDSSGNFLGPTGSSTTQVYRFNNSKGDCYNRTITAAAQKLTSVSGDQNCDDGGH